MDVARWTEPDFLDPARQWIDEQLADHGLAVTGEVEQPHVMKWSTVLRVPTAEGRCGSRPTTSRCGTRPG